ncbi:MAG TPA: hypothetical protein VE172_17410 [Stackebrandtia sp.]|jgi:hypothetical protein|uniref:hypothetical protein n=1 Tax=Stackebrandtia sp. TaxID=2023065 RepID=UPI002D4649C4|nr:hypothetical protein [Stackebrandtia sp.]HZE40583.1 hypothetical protein [Stackebrandtia sp.]
MTEIQYGLIGLIVVGLIIYRQLQPRRVNNPTMYYIAGFMILLGITSGGLVDPHHLGLSIVLLVIELVMAAALGMARAASVKLWTDDKGVAWSRGTWRTAVMWLVSMATRIVMLLTGEFVWHVHTSSQSVLIFVGLTIGVQGLVVARRSALASREPASPYSVVA